jgi:hypothetical protein
MVFFFNHNNTKLYKYKHRAYTHRMVLESLRRRLRESHTEDEAERRMSIAEAYYPAAPAGASENDVARHEQMRRSALALAGLKHIEHQNSGDETLRQQFKDQIMRLRERLLSIGGIAGLESFDNAMREMYPPS